jgi:hypothetical protein
MKVTSGTGSTESSTYRSRREHAVMPTHNGTALVGPVSCLAPEAELKAGIIGGRQKWSLERGAWAAVVRGKIATLVTYRFSL